MKTKQALTAGAFIVASVLCTGCVVALGNREQEHKATLGKQLTDLKQARDTGVINEEEYQAAKKRLIEGK